MSEWASSPVAGFYAPFTFQGWDDPERITNLPLDFAERHIKNHDEFADCLEAAGLLEHALTERGKGRWWQDILENRPDVSKWPVGRTDLWDEANRASDALLSQAAAGSEKSLLSAALLAANLLRGLRALAAHGIKNGRGSYLRILEDEVNAFEALARQRPEVFAETARKKFGVPGIISPSIEKTQSNVAFVAMLGVGTNLPFVAPVKAKKGATLSLSETAANLWALRLCNYLEGVRATFAIPEHQARIVANWAEFNQWVAPVWLEAAKSLPLFSRATCDQWAAVAWEVVTEATEGKPEANIELLPLGQSAGQKRPKYCKQLHEPTRQANVRAKIKARLKQAFRDLAPVAVGNAVDKVK